MGTRAAAIIEVHAPTMHYAPESLRQWASRPSQAPSPVRRVKPLLMPLANCCISEDLTTVPVSIDPGVSLCG